MPSVPASIVASTAASMRSWVAYCVIAVCFGVLMAPMVPSAARADVSIKWQNSASPTEADSLLADYLVNSNIITDFFTLIQENLRFDPDLVLVVGSEQGPEYAEIGRVLRLPYRYLGQAVETQAQLVEEGEVAIERALNVVEYTLYHLLGHALINDASVDADRQAEDIATWLMARSWPNGAEQWHANLQAFGEASQKLDGPLSDFWHKHALYAGRQRQLECLLLGQNAEVMQARLKAVLNPAERLLECQSAWRDLDTRMRRELDAVLAPTSPLRLGSG